MIKVAQVFPCGVFCELKRRAEREVLRKKYIASLENRTPEQIAEEEALYVEIKRLESNERKFARERDELLRTLAGVESGLASVAISTSSDEETFSNLFGDGKGNKKKRGLDLDSAISAGPGMISLGAPVTPTRKVQNAKNAAQGLYQPPCDNSEL